MPNPATRSGQRAARDFLRPIRETFKLVAAVDLGHAWLGTGELIVGHQVARYPYLGRPVPLGNGMYLNVQMTLRVHPARGAAPPRLQTLRSAYRYKAGHDLDDPKPLFVYEYTRHAPARYPRSHLHVFAAPAHYPLQRPFPRLHLPTRRITLEQIVWHLIHEHGVQPRRDDWHDILWRHETRFRDTQRDQDWPYDPPFPSPATG